MTTRHIGYAEELKQKRHLRKQKVRRPVRLVWIWLGMLLWTSGWAWLVWAWFR